MTEAVCFSGRSVRPLLCVVLSRSGTKSLMGEAYSDFVPCIRLVFFVVMILVSEPKRFMAVLIDVLRVFLEVLTHIVE